MSENTKKSNGNKGRWVRHHLSGALTIPFFLVLGMISVMSFIMPLRPTHSYIEKRKLAEFPQFSMDALLSGSYFDDITTWFSDTFPGREGWIELSNHTTDLHGHSEIMIEGTLEEVEEVPTQAPSIDFTPVTDPSEEEVPTETMVLQEQTAPTDPVEEWGGLNMEAADVISLGTVIQIGDSAFNAVTFSSRQSDRYIQTVGTLAEMLYDKGVRVVSAPCPTAVGIMIPPEQQKDLKCSRQDEIIDYINSGFNDKVYAVDTYSALVSHNDEYIYFRTDHHWTATGAYYSYKAICTELGMMATPLSSFEVWDQGDFRGSLYYKVRKSSALTLDRVYAYVPSGDITCMIYNEKGYGFEWPMLTDTSKKKLGSKYMTFLAGDHPLVVLTNNDMPDGPNCVIIKDSYGNCLAPFFTENYHNVYVLDYRYYVTKLSSFVEQYNIRDVIFAPNLGAVQAVAVQDLLKRVGR